MLNCYGIFVRLLSSPLQPSLFSTWIYKLIRTESLLFSPFSPFFFFSLLTECVLVKSGKKKTGLLALRWCLLWVITTAWCSWKLLWWENKQHGCSKRNGRMYCTSSSLTQGHNCGWWEYILIEVCTYSCRGYIKFLLRKQIWLLKVCPGCIETGLTGEYFGSSWLFIELPKIALVWEVSLEWLFWHWQYMEV